MRGHGTFQYLASIVVSACNSFGILTWSEFRDLMQSVGTCPATGWPLPGSVLCTCYCSPTQTIAGQLQYFRVIFWHLDWINAWLIGNRDLVPWKMGFECPMGYWWLYSWNFWVHSWSLWFPMSLEWKYWIFTNSLIGPLLGECNSYSPPPPWFHLVLEKCLAFRAHFSIFRN